jgi:rod shape determining protein RodA
MSSRNRQQIDWIILSIYLALVFIGWAMIYTVGYGQGGYGGSFFEFMDNPAGKQLLWVGIALLVMFASYLVEGKFWRTFANIIYILCMLSLALVKIFGKEINGATAWFDFGGGMTLQPSEFAKFGTIIALASYLGAYVNNLRSPKTIAYAVAFFLTPIMLLMLQPDAGSALVFMSLQLVLFREGLSGTILIVELLAGAILCAGFVTPPAQLVGVLAAVGTFLLVWNTTKRPYWLAAFVLLLTAGVLGIQYGQTALVLIGSVSIFFAMGVFQWFKKKERLVSLVVGSVIVSSLLAFMANFGFNSLGTSPTRTHLRLAKALRGRPTGSRLQPQPLQNGHRLRRHDGQGLP